MNWYVDFDSYGLRGERCRDALRQTIEFSEAPTCQLFTGFSGSGKTSELLRLTQDLEVSRHLVVLAESEASIDVLNPIEYSDVLINLGLACDEALASATKQGKVKPWAQRFGAELTELLFADVAFKQFKSKLPAGAELGLEIKENRSFRRAMREAANNSRRQLLDQVRELFSKAERAAVEAGFTEGLVLILDNLEKLSIQKDVIGSAVDMFIHHRDALRAPGVHTIYTIPASVVFSPAGVQLGSLYDGEPLVLPMVKVRDRITGGDHSQGIDALRDLLLRRLDVTEVFGDKEEPVKMLVKACGGYARDLLRMAQYSIQVTDSLPINEEAVRDAIARIRQSYLRGYSDTYLGLLTEIEQHRPQTIPSSLRPRHEEAIINHSILVYADWYDVHPIVRGLLSDLSSTP